MTVCDYVDAFSPFRFIRAFKFAIVRNPWQRLYSAYRFLEKGGMNQADARLADQVLSSHPSFDGFIRNWLTRENAQRHVHFRTQTSFLFDTSAHIYVDFIGFLENIDADFSTIVDKTGISRSLAHTNRSTESSALKGLEGLGEREVQVVEEIYAEDFHTFGYPRYSDTEIASLLSNVHEGSFFASRLREQRRSTSAKKQAD
ncbi:MAG: sulfotransferase family 2 domain-containing protein [Pseudomonadota bacterium]